VSPKRQPNKEKQTKKKPKPVPQLTNTAKNNKTTTQPLHEPAISLHEGKPHQSATIELALILVLHIVS